MLRSCLWAWVNAAAVPFAAAFYGRLKFNGVGLGVCGWCVALE